MLSKLKFSSESCGRCFIRVMYQKRCCCDMVLIFYDCVLFDNFTHKLNYSSSFLSEATVPKIFLKILGKIYVVKPFLQFLVNATELS